MIIELRKYNKVREILIRNDTTGLLGHVIYQAMGLEGICNYGSCPHEEDGDGAMNQTQGCIQSEAGLGIDRRHGHNGYGAIKEMSACNMEKDGKKQGLEPPSPRPADEVACQACGFVFIT